MATPAPRRLTTPSSVNAAIKQIADVMRRANYAGALQYVPELSRILFLRILDEREELEARKLDLKAVNPNRKSNEDTRTPEELLDIIESKGREIDAAIAELRASLSGG